MTASAVQFVGNHPLSRQRYQRAALTAVTAAVGKVVAVAAQLAIIPLMLSHLGVGNYGVWLTLQSILGLTALVDLGIPNAAMNALTVAAAHRDVRRLDGLVSTALALLVGIAAAVLVAAGVAWWALPWSTFLNATDGVMNRELSLGVAVFAAAFALSVPLGFVESFSAAFQQASVGNLARTVAAVGTLGATWLALRAGAPFSVVCITSVGPTLLAWVAAWVAALRMHPEVHLSSSSIAADKARSLARSGLAFYGIQFCAALGFGVDNLLISSLAGPEAVTRYAVPQRIFSIVLVAATICLAPLWPAYADARARGDEQWISKTLRLSLAATALLAALGTLAVSLAMPWLTKNWLGGAFGTTPLLAAGFAALTACQCLGSAVAFFWNGTGQLRIQLVLGLVFLAIAMPLKCLAISRFGLDWMPVVSAAVYASAILLPAWALSVRHAAAHGVG